MRSASPLAELPRIHRRWRRPARARQTTGTATAVRRAVAVQGERGRPGSRTMWRIRASQAVTEAATENRGCSHRPRLSWLGGATRNEIRRWLTPALLGREQRRQAGGKSDDGSHAGGAGRDTARRPLGLRRGGDSCVRRHACQVHSRLRRHARRRDGDRVLGRGARRGLGERPLIVELGTSRGAQIARLASALPGRAQFLGCDVSVSMLDAARADLAPLVEAGEVELRAHDLRTGCPRSSVRRR